MWQVSGHKLGRTLRDDLEAIYNRADKELCQRRCAQAYPLSPLTCTFEIGSSASVWSMPDEGGDGYSSDPGTYNESLLWLTQLYRN